MVSAEVGIVSLASAGLPSLLSSSPSSSPPCSDPGSPHCPLILLSSPEPKPPPRLHLGWEPHPSPGSWARGPGTQFSHPAAPLLPIAAGCVRSLPLFTFSLSLPRTLPSPPAMSPLPCPLLLCPSTLRMAFLAGEPPPRPPQPAIFTQSKWGCSRCLGPRPRPLSPLTPLLLEGTEPWPAGWGGGEVGVCCELLRLTWPSMPAFPPNPPKPGLLE